MSTAVGALERSGMDAGCAVHSMSPQGMATRRSTRRGTTSGPLTATGLVASSLLVFPLPTT
jgi:hypothetical protein